MIETIEAIRRAQAILVKEPPEDRRVWAGLEMAQAEAKRSLGDLEKKLAIEISDVAVPVFIDGPQSAALAKFMHEETQLAVVDLDIVYGALVDSIEATIGKSREFGVTQFSKIVTSLRQTAVEAGIAGVNVPSFGEPVVVATKADTAKEVLRFANQIVGHELALQYVRNQSAKQSVEELPTGGKLAVFPVLILNAPESVRAALSKTFKRSLDLTLTASNDPTHEEAIKALKTIKTALKPNKE